MSVAKILVDSAASFEYFSLLDGYSRYEFFFEEEDVSKIQFWCPRALRTYEWMVIPFGQNNASATY